MWKTVYAGNVKNSLKFQVSGFRFKLKPCRVQSRFLIACILLITLFFVASCSSINTYCAYSKYIFNGKSALKLGEYQDAKQYFSEASKQIRDSKSLAYLAATDYKLNDLVNAERFVREAEKIDNYSFDRLRILGYKTLILLKKNNDEGLNALKDYIELYKNHYPLPTLYEVEKMWNKKTIEIDKLEKLIEEQVTTYENDTEQYLSTKTGFRTMRGHR